MSTIKGLGTLLGLRPKDASAASVGASLSAAEAEVKRAAAAVADLEAGRGQLLLSASPAQVEAAERELAAARGEHDRAEAMVTALRAELVRAERAERWGHCEALSREANQAAEAFDRWWRDDYPRLLAAMVEGLSLEQKATRANDALMTAAANIERMEGASAYSKVFAAAPSAPVMARGAKVRLPDHANPDRLAWPQLG